MVAGDVETAGDGEHGHRPPATSDWPRGFGEASMWPFVAAVGGAGLYAGVGLVLLARGEEPLVGPLVGPAVVVASVGVLLGGLLGWVYHGFVEGYASRPGGHANRFRWGTLLFLGTDVATFGAGFFYYFVVRLGPWPPGELPALLSSLVLVNTGLLVASSVTLHAGHRTLRRGHHRRLTALLWVTLGLGTLFLVGQALEYYQFVVGEGLTLSSGVYFSAFFGLTALHGLHVLFGVLGLAVLAVRATAGQYSPDRHTSVTTVSLYWHFVDAVWLFLVVTLYVGATVRLERVL